MFKNALNVSAVCSYLLQSAPKSAFRCSKTVPKLTSCCLKNYFKFHFVSGTTADDSKATSSRTQFHLLSEGSDIRTPLLLNKESNIAPCGSVFDSNSELVNINTLHESLNISES